MRKYDINTVHLSQKNLPFCMDFDTIELSENVNINSIKERKIIRRIYNYGN